MFTSRRSNVHEKLLRLGVHARRGTDPRYVPLAEIHVHEGESLESALKRFKRKVLSEDIIKDIKRHAFYLKPGQRKRRKAVEARKRARKNKRRSFDGDSDRDRS